MTPDSTTQAVVGPPGPRPVHDPARVGLVAIDLDGTLTESGDIVSPRVRRALRRLVATGIHPVIATGRAIPGMLAAARQAGLREGWAVCSNGAVIVRLTSVGRSEFVVTDTVEFDPQETFARIRRALPTALLAVEDLGRGWRASAHFPRGELHGHLEVVDYSDLVSRPTTRAIVRTVDLGPGELAVVAGALDLSAVTYDIGWTGWMDLTAPGVSKASGLEVIRERLGVPREGTVAIGDGSNDISMLRWASRSAAMAGANAEVRAAASEQCPPVAHDGVATLIASIIAGVEQRRAAEAGLGERRVAARHEGKRRENT